MDDKELDGLIDEFEQMIPALSGILSSLRVHDWRPMFAKAKEIQNGFSSGARYPTKGERDSAWVRFNNIRSMLFERANAERSRFRSESESLKNEILGLIKWAAYSQITDMLFFFLPTTVDEMKRKGESVKEAGQALSQYKHRMLKEHKEECFSRIQEIRATHDAFWGEYKRLREEKQAESRQRRGEIANRIRGNLRANNERLEKAQGAYEHALSNLEANKERLAAARSPDFAERVAGWIAQDEEKLQSISESIEKIREWIEEDETRLADLEQRMSR
jgi:hypothetical protein